MYTLELQQQDDSAIQKVKGQLKHRVIGEARMNPRDLRSWDLANIEGLSQEEITYRLKTDDKLKMRDVARVEDISNPIAPPGNINLVSVSEENERRVALPEEQLKRLVINLFTTEKDSWKVEEMAQRLDQPR